MKTFLKEKIFPAGQAFHFARNFCDHTYKFSTHNHQFAEIFWIENGSGFHIVNKKKEPLIPWDLWIVLPENIHSHTVQQPFTMVNIAFPIELLLDFDSRYYYKSYFSRQSHFPIKIPIPLMIIPWLKNQIELLPQKTANAAERDLFLIYLFKELIPLPLFNSSKFWPGWFQTAIRIFQEQSDLSLSLQNWADLIGKSPEHLSREIKRHTGYTTMEFINRHRLEKASRLLSSTDISTIDIAYTSGYSSVSWFYKKFKKQYGCTPMQYRREMRIF
jgi:AraC-like DNA-binding protein